MFAFEKGRDQSFIRCLINNLFFLYFACFVINNSVTIANAIDAIDAAMAMEMGDEARRAQLVEADTLCSLALLRCEPFVKMKIRPALTQMKRHQPCFLQR